MRDFFVFHHIEKASGSTIHNLLKYNMPMYVSLRSWYPWTNARDAEFNIEDLRLLNKVYPALRGIGGHSTRPFFDYKKAFNKDSVNLKTFMFVRDPVKRYLSHLQYQIDKKNINWTLEAFCDEPRFNNFMVKRIAGSEDLEKAKAIVDQNVDFVGIQEDFNRSLLLLNKYVFDEAMDMRYESRNIGNKASKIEFNTLDEATKSRITENNDLDILLYKYIQEKFQNYLNDNSDLEAKLEAFERSLDDFKYRPFRKQLLRLFKGYNFFLAEPLVRYINHSTLKS